MTETSEVMEPWRHVWRKGFAPLMPTEGLKALAEALRSDDPRLIQGAATSPPPLQCVEDWPVEGACAVTFCGAAQHGVATLVPGKVRAVSDWTIGNAEEFFARACYDCDASLGEPAGCRHFLNAFDEWPRQEMIQNLLPEVERELDRRSQAAKMEE